MSDQLNSGPAYPAIAGLALALEEAEADFRRRLARAQFEPSNEEHAQALGYLADVDEELRQLRARVEKVWTHLVTVRTIKAEGGHRITPLDAGEGEEWKG